jgi:C4-dicarboxylate transporter DctM subunit
MVAYPAMIERGYQKRFILGLLACGGTLGILIPPSIPLIVFGAVTEESIGRLFIAGIIPGLVLTAILIVYAVYRSKRGGYVPIEAASWPERFRVTRRNLWGIALPFLILGGIYTGVFTPTEAAAVGLTYSLFITLFIYRTLGPRDLPDICLKAVGTSCMIALIISGALLFGRVLTLIEIPQRLTALIIDWKLSALMFVLAMNILMLFLGCILETVSIILLTVPLVAPILEALKIDPIWYAIVLTVNMEMALVTPPVGMNLYVINGLSDDIHMSEVIRGVAPFIVILAAFLLLTMLFPPMSTWLPSMMK